MARSDGRIEKGQSIRSAISARAWNRAQDAADAVFGLHPGTEGVPSSPGLTSYTWINAYNGSRNGTTIQRWQPVSIGGIFTPTQGADGPGTKLFEDSPVIKVNLFGFAVSGYPVHLNEDPWGVAVEPIAPGKIGRVAISGVVQTKVHINGDELGPDPRFVRPDFTRLWLTTSLYSGGARILYSDSTPQSDGLSWAIIRLGHDQSIRRGIVRSLWKCGDMKTIQEVGAAGSYTVDGEQRQQGGTAVYQPNFDAWNFLATLDSGPAGERWVYCALVGAQWHLIAYEVFRKSGASLAEDESKRIFT